MPGRCSLTRLSDGREGSASCEELVHDLGDCGNDRPQFASVDDLGGSGAGVPYQPGDLLDADATVAQQTDERGPQLASSAR